MVKSLYSVEEESKSIFVYIEQTRGEIENVSLEMLSKGRELADQVGFEVNGLLLGRDVSHLTEAVLEHGADKLTFLASKKTSPLIPWIEQLVAESTGKQGKGVIPIENEPAGKIETYGKDRLLVFYSMGREKDTVSKAFKNSLVKHKYPFIELSCRDREELAAQFLMWEAATAVCGFYLDINPFDETDCQ